MQIPHNLKLRLSDCGKAIETSGLASVTVAQMNPCGSLDKDENATLGNLLASAPDLLRQRDKLREALKDLEAIAGLINARQHAGCDVRPDDWSELHHCTNVARAILAETEAV